MRDQRFADQFLREAGAGRLVLGDFHAARFSSAAGMDLRFHDKHGRIQFVGPSRRCLGRGNFFSSRHRNSKLGKQRLGLKFMNVHIAP
jgi:hypothetical protein